MFSLNVSIYLSVSIFKYIVMSFLLLNVIVIACAYGVVVRLCHLTLRSVPWVQSPPRTILSAILKELGRFWVVIASISSMFLLFFIYFSNYQKINTTCHQHIRTIMMLSNPTIYQTLQLKYISL